MLLVVRQREANRWYSGLWESLDVLISSSKKRVPEKIGAVLKMQLGMPTSHVSV